MKFNYTKLSILLTFMPFICLQSVNTYGMCFDCEVDLEAEFKARALKTRFIKVRSTASDDKYQPTVPKIYRDKSRSTSYQAPASLKPLPIGALFGFDDRVRVYATTKPESRVPGRLEMTFPGGKKYVGSGTVVNRRHVITAGHCLYDIDTEEWATSIKFTAAQDGYNFPISSAYATHLVTVKGWADYKKSDYDMGMLILDRNVGEETVWFGMSTDWE